jgi:glycosyltransferase involved in cell wall biosynthesis
MAKCLQITGNSSYGGAGYLLLGWCRYLLARGWQVDILATDPLWVSELKKIPGLRIIQDVFIPRDITPAQDLKAFVQLVSLMRRESYDVVHTYTATPGFLGRMAARFVGVPVILHHQAGWTVNEFSSWRKKVLYTPIEYLVTLASTKSICVSYAVEKQAHRFHIAPLSKLVIIRNGIEPQPYIAATQDNNAREALRQELGFADHHLLIGNTGRLSPQKNNGALIQAMAPLKSLMPDVPFTLLLAGDGPDQAKLEELIRSMAIGEQVRLLGFRRDISTFLAGIDIFVSPSLWEGLSISLLEAMSAAKPIVTTSVLPNAELIEHQVTGLLVPPQAPEQIAQAIARFVNEPGLAQSCGIAARQRVLEDYSMDRMFQETWDLYIDLLSEKQPKGRVFQSGKVSAAVGHRSTDS